MDDERSVNLLAPHRARRCPWSAIPGAMADDVRDYWDDQAATFDEEPDHGLRDAVVRDAWSALLARLLPPAPADVVDLGCGTGGLSVLLADAGYAVRGLDLSDRMVAAAAGKAEELGVSAAFRQ